MNEPTLYELTGLWKGRLAIVPRPRGGDWLEDDIRSLSLAGVDLLVSSLNADEQSELELTEEAALCRAIGIEYVTFPIPDRGVPSSVEATGELIERIHRALARGATVAIHCRAAIGRSSLLAASVLVAVGIPVDAAFTQIEQARGCAVPDTDEQRTWVQRFAAKIRTAGQRAAS